MAGIHEECGVFGIFSPQRTDLATLSYYALYALQHRGQESAGIAINDDGVFSSCRDTGLVAEVFSPEKLRRGQMALAHNGNLTNAFPLRRELESRGSIFHSTSDTEVIAYTIVQERLSSPSIEAAISAAMDRLEGAYSLVISSPSKLIAARDPHGFRPLCMGKLPDGAVVFASETCALDAIGAAFVRDVLPGEIVTGQRGRHRL